MKILLFGARGRIGKLIHESFVSKGHEVLVAKRISSGRPRHLEYVPGQRLNIPPFEHVDVIINASGKYFVKPVKDEISTIRRSILSVSESIALTNEILATSILNLSTYFQYLPLPHSDIYEYTLAKKISHNILLDSCTSQQRRYLDLVLLDNFGSNSNHKFLDSLLISTRLQIPMKCSVKETPINLIHINDLISGIHVACEKLVLPAMEEMQESRTLSGSISYKLIDLANLVSSASGLRSILEWDVLDPRIPSDFDFEILPKKLEGWNSYHSVENYISDFFC